MDDVEPFNRGGAFLADGLALARCERIEEVLEIRIALVRPVELGAFADQPAGPAEEIDLVRLYEIGVRARQVVLIDQRLRPRDQRARRFLRPGEQARAGHRGKGYGDQQLGIISAARALPGIRPAVIEDIFALAMAFDIGGDHALQRAVAVIERDRHRLPAGPRYRAARLFERGQKAVRYERICAACAPIPVAGVEAAHAFAHAEHDRGAVRIIRTHRGFS